jgi:hypothetical protein
VQLGEGRCADFAAGQVLVDRTPLFGGQLAVEVQRQSFARCMKTDVRHY